MLQLIPILHIVGAVFAFVDLVLSAVVVDYFLYPPPAVSFVLFCSIWSLLVLAYVALSPIYYPRAHHPTAVLALLVVTTIFWFAGAIAEAHQVGTYFPLCGHSNECRSAQASVAFSFFNWVVFTILSVFEGMAWWRSRGRSGHHGGPKP